MEVVVERFMGSPHPRYLSGVFYDPKVCTQREGTAG